MAVKDEAQPLGVPPAEPPETFPPDWAVEWGVDRYGAFADFLCKGVVQRMRWIGPGTFLMGSPESEPGRELDETLHEVTLTQGFWLADTPCTQALWEAVIGDNPSRFVSEARPLENVSWEHCRAFLRHLSGILPGSPFYLPTEAQWEYACRAGTTTATYAGEMEILGERNAPILDAIAWYGGNSGVGFDLKDGNDSSGWQEKQYDHRRAGTRLVKGKAPNRWGLYDMLGNVSEWCQDWAADYPSAPVQDPTGPDTGECRVLRGGCWFAFAEQVRSAVRFAVAPGGRDDDFGLRLARGQ